MDILLSDNEQQLLKDIIYNAPSTATFVEYGCGGSTILFAESMRESQHLHSIEHNKEWFDTVSEELHRRACTNVTMHLREPRQLLRDTNGAIEAINETTFRPYATPHEELPMGLEDYIHAHNTNIDWSHVYCVFVDGVARGPILALLPYKLQAHTGVLLHDAAGREVWYQWSYQKQYVQLDMVGSMLVMKTRGMCQ